MVTSRGNGRLGEVASKVDMDSQIQEWEISSDMPEEETELLIREFGERGISADEPEAGIGRLSHEFGEGGTSADEPEAGIGPLSHEFGEGVTSADEPEADIGPLDHEFGESWDSSPDNDIRPLFADWGPPAAARKFDEWRASVHDPEADIGPLDHEFGESGDSSPYKDIRPLFADWGPPAAARKFDKWRASADEQEAGIGPLSHEFGESGDSVRQTEVAIGQGECVETTDKPELDTKTVIPWTTNWWVPADKLKVIPRGTNWWPVPVPADKPEVDEETVGATNDMIPETSVIRTVFYFKMDPPLPLGAEWGHGPRKYDCGTCFDELSDHMNSSCPFMALATQFNETKSTGMSLGGKKKGTEKSSRFEAYFPPVLSPAERTAANLMTRRKMNLIRICNYLDFSKVGEIKKLFKKFGRVIHAYIPIPGGNGFVNFVRRVDALIAIKKMNGYEFEGLKLRVVWAYFDASRVDV